MTEEQHAQVVQDNLRLIEINHDLRLELDTCKKAIGKCNSEATELHSMACAHERSGDAFMPIWGVKKRAKDIKLACAETFAGQEEVKPEDMTTCSAYDLLSEREREILRMWPRFEDTGELVWFGDETNLTDAVKVVSFVSDGSLLIGDDHGDFALDRGERVKRKAEQDTWEKIEKEATSTADEITKAFNGDDYAWARYRINYLVRRCKALADRGE